MRDRLIVIADIESFIPCLLIDKLIQQVWNSVDILKLAIGNWHTQTCDPELLERNYILVQAQPTRVKNTKLGNLIELLEKDAGVSVMSNNPVFIEDIKKIDPQRIIHVVSRKQNIYHLTSPTIEIDLSTMTINPSTIASKKEFINKLQQFIKSRPDLITDMNMFCSKWYVLHRVILSELMKQFDILGKPSKFILATIEEMKTNGELVLVSKEELI